jgi:hypothetical protein
VADKPAFISTQTICGPRRKACDPDEWRAFSGGSQPYRSLAQVANASIIEDPEYWRNRADEMRRAAEKLSDEDKQAMLCIAKDYDRLAEWAKRKMWLVRDWMKRIWRPDKSLLPSSEPA